MLKQINHSSRLKNFAPVKPEIEQAWSIHQSSLPLSFRSQLSNKKQLLMPSDRSSVLTPRSVNPKFQIQIDTNFSPNSYDSFESKQLRLNT